LKPLALEQDVKMATSVMASNSAHLRPTRLLYEERNGGCDGVSTFERAANWISTFVEQDVKATLRLNPDIVARIEPAGDQESRGPARTPGWPARRGLPTPPPSRGSTEYVVLVEENVSHRLRSTWRRSWA
jgi:hypothetical protein